MGKTSTPSRTNGRKGAKPYDQPQNGRGGSKVNKRKTPHAKRPRPALDYARFCKRVMGFHNNFKRVVKLRRGQVLASHAQALKKCRLRLPNETGENQRLLLERRVAKLSAEFPILKRLDRNKLADCLLWRLLQDTGELDKFPALAKVVDSLNLCKDNFADIPVHLPEETEEGNEPAKPQVPSADEAKVIDPTPSNVSPDSENSAYTKKYLNTIFNEFRTNKKIRSVFDGNFKRFKTIERGSESISPLQEPVPTGPTAEATGDSLPNSESDEGEAPEPAQTKSEDDDSEGVDLSPQADKKRVHSSESKAHKAERDDTTPRKPKRSKKDTDSSKSYDKQNDKAKRNTKGCPPEAKVSSGNNNTDPASLHPSWEAKRLQREQQKLALKESSKTKNTKIVFDGE